MNTYLTKDTLFLILLNEVTNFICSNLILFPVIFEIDMISEVIGHSNEKPKLSTTYLENFGISQTKLR